MQHDVAVNGGRPDSSSAALSLAAVSAAADPLNGLIVMPGGSGAGGGVGKSGGGVGNTWE